jgi:hypothetical protein
MLLYFCRMYYVCVYGNFVSVKFTSRNLIISSVTVLELFTYKPHFVCSLYTGL